MEYPLEQLFSYLKSNLSPNRFRHSQGVMELMRESATIYGMDPEKAAFTGLVHDIAKEISDEVSLARIKQSDPDFLEEITPHCYHGVFFHGAMGAIVLEEDFGIKDREVLAAVRDHNLFKPFAPKLSRCLHVADVSAPSKEFPGAEKLKTVFLLGDIDRAELLVDVWLQETFPEMGMPTHPKWADKVELLRQKVGLLPQNFFSRTE